MWWMYGVIDAVCVPLIAWLAFPRDKRLYGDLQDFCDRSRAYVAPEFVGEFLRSTRNRYRAGAALILAILALLPFADRFAVGAGGVLDLVVLVLVGLVFALSSLARLRAAGREFPVPIGWTAQARPRRVVLTDYLPRFVLVVTWVGAGMAGLIGAATLVLAVRGRIDVVSGALIVVGAAVIVAGTGLATAFARAICDRPQRAADACHLYFLDAWRGLAINRAFTVLLLLAEGYSMVVASTPIRLPWFLVGVCVASVATMAVFLLTVVASNQALTFRRRLRGGLPPGSVLMPGQPAPPRMVATA